MAEIVVIKERNGVEPGSDTALTNITARFCTIDAAQPGTSNPCKVPTSNFYYSYWKSLFADVSGTGWTSIRDIKWYCDGTTADSWGLDKANGGGMVIGKRDTGDNGCPQANYDQALGDPGNTGYFIGDPINGHTWYYQQATPTKNADDCTASSPHLIDSTVYTAAFQSKFWLIQIKIPPTAAHGELTAKTHTITYQVY